MEETGELKRLLDAERYAEAEKLLDGLIAGGARGPELHHLRAVARHFQHDLEPDERRRRVAEDLISSVEAGRGTFDEETIQSCSLLFHWAYKDEGEAAVAAMLAERPDDGAAALYQRARFVERFKADPAAATSLLDRSIAREPHWRAHWFRSLLRVKAVRYDEAARDLDESLRLNPQAREAWLARARLRMKLDQADGAVADFAQAFSLREPTAFEEWMEAAQAHLENGEPAKAVEDFSRALAFFPGPPPDILYRRAQARQRAGDRAGALADLDRALEADAGFAPALALKARLST